MNKRTYFLSVAAYFCVTMAVAYPWHTYLFHEKYLALGAFTRGEPIVPFGMLAAAAQGAVFAYFFPLYRAHRGGGHAVRRGVEFSLFLGLTVYTVMVFATAAKFDIEPVEDFLLLGTAFQALQFTGVGIAFGWIESRAERRRREERSAQPASGGAQSRAPVRTH